MIRGLAVVVVAAGLIAAMVATNGNPLAESDPVPSATTLGPVTAPYPVDDARWSDCRGGYVALTFDDGPHPAITPKLQRALQAEGIRGTFFLIGVNVAQWPRLAAQIAADGHAVGNHTYDHKDLPGMTPAEVKAEMTKTTTLFAGAGLPRTDLFRPPKGNTTEPIAETAEGLGMTEVGWTVDTVDWRPGRAVAGVVSAVAAVRARGIVLLHELHPVTVAAVPGIARSLRSRHMCPGRVLPSARAEQSWQGWTFRAGAAPW